MRPLNIFSIFPALLTVVCVALLCPRPVSAQIRAQARPAPRPPWDKGILPISAESYWNAVECGKQGGADPPCVFWDTGICKNSDFALAFYTPYKMVAYEVWNAVRQKQPAPTPNYAQAQKTRVTVGVTPVTGSKNPLTDFILKRGARVVVPVDRSLDGGGGRFTFDYPAFAATASVTLDMAGRAKTISCVIPQSVLSQFR
jgi:hypothetical protein